MGISCQTPGCKGGLWGIKRYAPREAGRFVVERVQLCRRRGVRIQNCGEQTVVWLEVGDALQVFDDAHNEAVSATSVLGDAGRERPVWGPDYRRHGRGIRPRTVRRFQIALKT